MPLTQIQVSYYQEAILIDIMCQSQSITPMMTFDPAKSAGMPNRSFDCKIAFQADTNPCPNNEI